MKYKLIPESRYYLLLTISIFAGAIVLAYGLGYIAGMISKIF
jgi:uncharacterized membrane protein YhdT